MTESPKRAPAVPVAVVEWLEALFPDRLPSEPGERDEFVAKVGEQRVIRRLRREFERQQRENRVLG